MILNTILVFFTNVLASLVSNALSRIPLAVLILVGVAVAAWITYMIVRSAEKKKVEGEVGSEAGGSMIGDLFADGIEAIGEAAAMI